MVLMPTLEWYSDRTLLVRVSQEFPPRKLSDLKLCVRHLVQPTGWSRRLCRARPLSSTLTES
eukprot:m.156140 g.156140  ORF g.156140 m.156140 type:complete len:62 (+) comp23612_c1_seq1:2152-2337(+)